MATSARIDDLRKKFDENPRRYFAPLANEYRKAGDLAQAIAICRQHLADQPGHMSGHIVYGQALFENKEYEEAQKVFTAALALDPENLIALRHLGDIARDATDYAGARGWYQRVLDADPRNEDIQAQIKLVQEAEERAAAEAARQPEPTPMNVAAVTPLATPAVPTPRSSQPVHEAATIEIERVTPPWAKAKEPEPAPAPPLEEADVAPPRLSLMGLDLESMAAVEDDTPATLVPRPATPNEGFETSVPFSSTQFDGDLETDTNPLAGISGIETRDESSAASLLPSAPPAPLDADFVVTPPFSGETAAPPPAELPPELQMPLRVTPPTMDLGLAPQPKAEPTGLWDTLEDLQASEAQAVEQGTPLRTSAANFEPPPVLFTEPAPAAPSAPVLPSADAFELVDESASPSATPAHAAAPSEPFVTETMGDLYVQQGHVAQALDTYRQLLQQRPGDAQLLGKIAALEAAPAHAGPRARDFFAALAGWRPGQGAAMVHVAPAALEAPHEAAAAAPHIEQAVAAASPAGDTAEEQPWMSARAFDLGVFAGATVSRADESAARRLAAMYPDGAFATEAPASAAPAGAAATAVLDEPASAPSLPGQPARQASGELSLDQVFSEPAPPRPSRKSASFSFDQFFSQTAQAPVSPMKPTPSVLPAVPSPEEAEQFQNWLKGLKAP
ncbi:MAG: tetratricopeptide repeat protein [Gemmatimonadetes bacterium]|nr:tetratricopeptide repeat protein [Gemmatimonadota bacterium]